MGFRFIPRLRHIDEARQAALYAEKYGLDATSSTGGQISTSYPDSDSDLEKKAVTKIKASSLSDAENETIQWEVRDEANRSWFRAIFDEYEYKPKILKEKQLFSWFNKNDSREEKILITKIDIIVCFYSLAMYWVKYLDQTNINNAYVSGMKEELNMTGNDFVNTQVVYLVSSLWSFSLP